MYYIGGKLAGCKLKTKNISIGENVLNVFQGMEERGLLEIFTIC